MQKTQDIRIEDFNIRCPTNASPSFPSRNATTPNCWSTAREPSREHHFYDLPRVLPPDSLLVFNNTR